MADQQKFEVKVSKKYENSELRAIGQEVIDYIVKRTQQGLDKSNKSLPGYSKSYMKSLDFKIAGKSKNVDLTLSGDMLSLLQVLKIEEGKIVIGYKSGDKINGRVEGNVLGTYGQSSPIKGKKRDFLGIKTSDLRGEILSNYPLSDREESLARADQIKTLIKESKTEQDILVEDATDG
jgi:hypothetical protein